MRDLARQMLAALSHLHDNVGVMHRDLKPDNFVFADAHKQVLKLCDFGFATAAPTSSAYVGTELYMAPEIRRRDYKSYTKLCDVRRALHLCEKSKSKGVRRARPTQLVLFFATNR